MREIKKLFKNIILSGIFSAFYFGKLLSDMYHTRFEAQIVKIATIIAIVIGMLYVAFLTIKAINELFDLINSKDKLIEEMGNFIKKQK